MKKHWIAQVTLRVEGKAVVIAETEEGARELLTNPGCKGVVLIYETLQIKEMAAVTLRPCGCHECGCREGEMHKPDCPKMARIRAEEEKESQS